MRTFILGLGAQKAGTTWFFKQLVESKRFVPGMAKEYHVFDSLYLGGGEFAETKSITTRLRNYSKLADERVILKNLEIMKSFYQDDQNYFDYFDSLLKGEDDFTSDISPAYSGLSREVLAKIKKEFNQRGIAVKVVFIMREPIGRLESAIRMGLRRKKILREISEAEVILRINNQLGSKDELQRANYLYTSQQIDRVFPAKDVFYGFYETLFSENQIQRLSDFCNLEPEEFDSSAVFNATPRLFKYPLDEIEKLKGKVQDRYQFVSERFDFDVSIWDEAIYKMVKLKEG